MKRVGFLQIVFVLGLTVFVSCGGGTSKPGSAKVKSNAYLGKLPGTVDIYLEEEQRINDEAEAEAKKKYGGLRLNADQFAEMQKKYGPREEANNIMLLQAIEAAGKELVGKNIPFESRHTFLEAVSIIISDVDDDHPSIGTYVLVKAKEPFPLEYTYAVELFLEYLDSEGKVLHRSKCSANSNDKKMSSTRKAEIGEEFKAHMNLILADMPSMTDLEKIVIITKEEFGTK